MTKILAIDLECIHKDLLGEGIQPEDRIMEIGAVLWDWEKKKPLKFYSELFDEKDRIKPIPPSIQQLTGIDDMMLVEYGSEYGDDLDKKLEPLFSLICETDYLISHNAPYDKKMLTDYLDRTYGRGEIAFEYAGWHNGMVKNKLWNDSLADITLKEKLWIDSLTDIIFPPHFQSKSLAMLEYQHGFINPFPHRALTDCLSLLKIVSHYDLGQMVELAKSPMVELVAMITPPSNWKNEQELNAFNKRKAKISQAGFIWYPELKQWKLSVKQKLLDMGLVGIDEFSYKTQKGGEF